MNKKKDSGAYNLNSLNAALQELLPYVNAHLEPDWSLIASKYGLDDEHVGMLKQSFYKYG